VTLADCGSPGPSIGCDHGAIDQVAAIAMRAAVSRARSGKRLHAEWEGWASCAPDCAGTDTAREASAGD
jgi:hypothetical protein